MRTSKTLYWITFFQLDTWTLIKHERDCHSRANERDRMGQNGTILELNMMTLFLKNPFLWPFMNGKWELVTSFLMVMNNISHSFSVISHKTIKNDQKCAYHNIILSHLSTLNNVHYHSCTVNNICSYLISVIHKNTVHYH